MKLSAVVVDIWVLGIPLDGFLEVAVGLFLFAYILLDSSELNEKHAQLTHFQVHASSLNVALAIVGV